MLSRHHTQRGTTDLVLFVFLVGEVMAAPQSRRGRGIAVCQRAVVGPERRRLRRRLCGSVCTGGGGALVRRYARLTVVEPGGEEGGAEISAHH